MITIPNGGVWGCPWHGLATSGIIAGSSKAITQPTNGNAWLIDMGLPAISLTSAETAEATANNYEWRNYAMISGGRLYDTALPAESFIHVDAADQCWLVTLSYSYPATNTLRVTASIKRFGLFGHGAAAAITKTADVVCNDLTISGGESREYWLNDVWTNGVKCLVGVGIFQSPTRDLVSVVEINISGTGGTDGSGLSVSGSEVIVKADLSPGSFDIEPTNTDNTVEPYRIGSLYAGTANGVIDIFEAVHTCDFGDPADTIESRRYYSATGPTQDFFWYGDSPTGFGGGYSVVDLESIGGIYAKEAFYNSSGSVKVLRVKFETTTENHLTGFSGPTCSGFLYTYCNQPPTNDAITYNDKYLSGSTTKKLTILLNNDAIDSLGSVESWTGEQHSFSELLGASGHVTTITPTGTVISGSLSSYLSSSTDIITSTILSTIAQNFRKKTTPSDSSTAMSSGKYIGLQAIDAKSASFYYSPSSGAARNYGTVTTPLGNKTYTGTPTANIFFAWQRKTGDFSFATSPICYV